MSSTEYANLVQLVFNKTVDLVSAVSDANSNTMAATLKVLNTEAAALSAHYIYPALVYVLGKSVEASKQAGIDTLTYIKDTYPEI